MQKKTKKIRVYLFCWAGSANTQKHTDIGEAGIGETENSIKNEEQHSDNIKNHQKKNTPVKYNFGTTSLTDILMQPSKKKNRNNTKNVQKLDIFENDDGLAGMHEILANTRANQTLKYVPQYLYC